MQTTCWFLKFLVFFLLVVSFSLIVCIVVLIVSKLLTNERTLILKTGTKCDTFLVKSKNEKQYCNLFLAALSIHPYKSVEYLYR